MKFVIKTDSIPLCISTDNWFAGEDIKTGYQFININKKSFLIDPESFELMYDMNKNKCFDKDTNMTAVLDLGHISIWRL